eukprot:gene22899-29658_t
MNIFVFVGAPGVGKGTFAKLISKLGVNNSLHEKVLHISLGDVFRKINNGSDLNYLSKYVPDDLRELKDCLSSGRLVADHIANSIIEQEIASLKEQFKDQKLCFILDGYPRTLQQAQSIHELYKNLPFSVIDIRLERWIAKEKILGRRQCFSCGEGFNLAHIVFDDYHMPSKHPDPVQCEAVRGIPCRPDLALRSDDIAEVIERRFDEYEKKTEPILNYFSSLGILKTFQVKRGVQDVQKLIEMMRSS